MKNAMILLFAMVFSTLTFAEAVWIDVRSAEEYAQDHISGDIRISHDKIVSEVEKQFPDKNTEIHLYCKSGGRAGKAQSELQRAGYTDVTNAGGIEDARKQRGLDHPN